MPNGSDIIIRARSAEVEYDPDIYPVDPSDRKKHKNEDRRITRVEITGDINWDSGDIPSGSRFVIRAHVVKV